MKIVRFITGVVETERRVYHEKDLQYASASMDELRPVGPGEYMAKEEGDYQSKIVPIHHLRRCLIEENPALGTPPVEEEVYIAYTEEVQSLLEMPFTVLQHTIDDTRTLLNEEQKTSSKFRKQSDKYYDQIWDFCNAPIWRRFKLAWKGKIK